MEYWMSKLPQIVKEIPLNQLFLPGSHDSFSYSLKWGKIGPDAPSAFTHLESFSWIAKSMILKWAITQRSTAHEQLSHGIRYFDFRVAAQDNKLYFVHLLFGENLEILLKEIRDFLDSGPEEVVLLDFQHFYGISEDHHLYLINLLTDTFSGLICPLHQSLSSLSLSYLFKKKYQVIIFYRDFVMQKKSGFWPGKILPNPWPDTTKRRIMMSFVEQQIHKRSEEKFFVTQCVLTPTGGYIAKHLSSSLENLALRCNDRVLEWISTPSFKSLKPNIIMTDFVEYKDWAIPKAVIQLNLTLHST